MNIFCVYHFSVRRTVIELQPIIRLAIRTLAARLQGHPRSKLMVPLERASMSLFESIEKNDVGRTVFFMVEPFLDALPVA